MHFGFEYCISKRKKWFNFKQQQQKEIEPIFFKIFPLLDRAIITLRNIGHKGVLFLEALQQLQVKILEYDEESPKTLPIFINPNVFGRNT